MKSFRYPNKAEKTSTLLKLSFKNLWPAMRHTFFGFLFVLILSYGFSFLGVVKLVDYKLMTLKFIAYLVTFYFYAWLFYRVHQHLAGIKLSWGKSMLRVLLRYFPVFASVAVIFVLLSLCIGLGFFLSHILLPYVKGFGSSAGLLLITFCGIFSLFVFVVLFYWPLYLLMGWDSFKLSVRKSLMVFNQSKQKFLFAPIVVFVFSFILLAKVMPWFHWVDSIYYVLILSFVMQWVLFSWVINAACLAANNAEFTVLKKKKTDWS